MGGGSGGPVYENLKYPLNVATTKGSWAEWAHAHHAELQIAVIGTVLVALPTLLILYVRWATSTDDDDDDGDNNNRPELDKKRA
mmetsp:Transcript_14040/g.58632  ORF Transcript_14040/g.58632 Transcript_14040/m.58632 type:complete len:84 (+) Transcript_14040:68-319(+)|eukprot:PRCOL_00006575-RA